MKRHTLKKQYLLPALSCVALLTASPSHAAVMVTFEQVGDDVTATWSGSLNPGSFNRSDFNIDSRTFATSTELIRITPGPNYRFQGGTASPTTLTGATFGNPISSGAYSTFGFTGTQFYTDQIPGLLTGDELDFTGTNSVFTYSNRTLSQIGAENFDNTLAWTSSAGGTNTVSYTTIIPEPSSALLITSALAGLLLRRKR